MADKIEKPPLGEIAIAGAEHAGAWDAYQRGLKRPTDKVLQAKGGDWSIYEDVLRDDQVKATLQQRRGAVIARDWDVEAGGTAAIDKAAAAALKENLQALAWDRVSGKMHYGVFYGWSVAELIYRVEGRRVVVDDIKVRRRSRFAWHADGSLRLLRPGSPEGEPMPERKFWTFSTGGDHDDDPYGLGLAHFLYWPVFFKKNDIVFWLTFLEKFSTPTVLANYAPGASADEVKRLLAAAAAVARDAAIAMPETMKITLLEAQRSGSSDYSRMHAVMDAAIAKIVLSQTMTTDDGSSRAQAEVHEGVRDDVVKEDADLLCESFNRGPAQWLTQWNFPGARTPRVWRRVEDEPNTKPIADRDQVLYDMGWRRTEQSMIETFGPGFERRPETGPRSRATGDRPGARDDGPALAEGEPPRDSIDDLVDEMLAEWEPAMAPLVEPIRRALKESGTAEEFRARLPAAIAAMDTGRIEDLLMRGGVAASLAGAAGDRITDTDDA